PPKHEVRGTLTGLAGTGLVLTDVDTGAVATLDGASFTFGRSYDAGIHYDVRIDAQPIHPTQACTVANGTGTVPDHDVTDIAVACVTLADNPALDPAFGAGGKAIAFLPPAHAVAIQPDGKIVTVGGMTLARFNADGTLDTGFGTGGSVVIVANAGRR